MADNQRTIILDYIQAYNAIDIEGMAKNLHENVLFENISDGQVNLATKGIEAFTKQAEAAKKYFAQREQKITSWNFEENKVTIHISYKAILALDLASNMKAGDTLQLQGQSTFTFKDGLISSIQDRS